MRKTGIKRRILTACLAAAMILSSGVGSKAGIVNAESAGVETISSETTEFSKSKLKINFAVLENSKLTTPTKKSYVVVDMGKDGDSIENPVLVLANQSTGKEITVKASKVDGTSLLFYPKFSDESYTGVYSLKSIQYSLKGKKYEKLFKDDGIDTKLGVNKDPDVTPDGYLTGEEHTADELVKKDSSVKGLSSTLKDTSVIGTGDVNKNLAGKAIAENKKSKNAFNNVKGSNAPGNIVIVLDPGHGGNDAGASYTWEGVTYEERTINQKIANYCKAALEKNEGVTVYLTRTSSTEKNKDELGEDDLRWRCKFAYEKGADLFVSIHCNASTNNESHGAEVYVPNSSYNSRAYNVGKTVGASIGKKLAKLGISGGATYIRNSETNNQYSDGSLADYYAVIRHSKEYGIPGMIVEHCYLSNYNDCMKYLKTDDKLKALGEADAAGIAENIGLIQQNRSGTNPNVAGWQQVGKDWVYYDKDGNLQTGFFKVKGKTYYGKSNGYIVTGWSLIDGNWYCFNKKGVMFKKSWQINSSGSYSYLLEDGKMATGVTKTDKGYYYFDSDGIMQTGWKKIKKNWYYMDKSGLMYRAKWLKDGSNTYYLKADGKMATGFIKKGKNRYYMNSKGIMQTGWKKINNKWYYLGTDGKAKTSEWMSSDGCTYYFNDDSTMAVGPTKIGEDMYYFSNDGDKLTGWIKHGIYWFLSDAKGKLKVSEWYKEGKKTYYFDENGKMVTGTRIIDNKTYKFNENGALISKTSKKTLHPIMAKSKYTAEQMANRYKEEGKRYPVKNMTAGGAKNINEFCQIIVEEAEAEGVSAELVFAQIMHETGWLQFGGNVKVSQYNFCGLGAVGGGDPGCSFPDVRTGIRAQVQHLKAYASTEDLKNESVDPRFQYVERGCAKYIEYLGIKENPKGKGWATDPGYGTKLLNIIYTLKK